MNDFTKAILIALGGIFAATHIAEIIHIAQLLFCVFIYVFRLY